MTQFGELVALENLPTTQLVHTEEPLVLEYFPAEQSVQDVEATAPANIPG
jgi:hypothetical protein